MKQRILIVEDDPDVVKVVSAYLHRDGFDVEVAHDGLSGLFRALEAPPALVVLDRMLPDLDGLEVLRRLRRERRTPVILLTARTEEADRIEGLDAGADDYVLKPYSPRELVSRIRAVLRRAEALMEERPVLQTGPLRIDPSRRTIEVGRVSVDVTTIEFDLLYTLAATPGRVFTRGELLDRVWGDDFVGVDRVVDVHLSNLRRKLQAVGADESLGTVRGVGYRLEP